MRWIRVVATLLAVGVFSVRPSAAQTPSTGQSPLMAPLLRQILSGHMTLSLSSGRIVHNGNWPFGNGPLTNNIGLATEQVQFQNDGRAASLSYGRNGPDEDFRFELNSQGRLRFRRTAKNPKLVPVEFLQVPGEPICLTVGAEGHQRIFRAPTIWHLWIAEPQICRDHVGPVFVALHPQWQLDHTVAAVETELIRLAGNGQSSDDHRQWSQWVEQLGDSRFTRREAADRLLREAGPTVLGYLRQLDATQLDAEQQFRIRRIVHSFSGHTVDDTPEQVAATLLHDPAIWLALLTRSEASTRRTAAQQLTGLLGEPVAVDPAADPATQEKAIEVIRTKIEKRRPEKTK